MGLHLNHPLIDSASNLFLIQKVQFDGFVHFGGNITAVFLSLLDALCQQVFDLPVDGAEIIICPSRNSIIQLGG